MFGHLFINLYTRISYNWFLLLSKKLFKILFFLASYMQVFFNVLPLKFFLCLYFIIIHVFSFSQLHICIIDSQIYIYNLNRNLLVHETPNVQNRTHCLFFCSPNQTFLLICLCYCSSTKCGANVNSYSPLHIQLTLGSYVLALLICLFVLLNECCFPFCSLNFPFHYSCPSTYSLILFQLF